MARRAEAAAGGLFPAGAGSREARAVPAAGRRRRRRVSPGEDATESRRRGAGAAAEEPGGGDEAEGADEGRREAEDRVHEQHDEGEEV